ncbi:hypothetical protein GF420_09830 [candidate division GN15 bacterium]|nr:hypothetical protein [candidate division GN15 bacterium]
MVGPLERGRFLIRFFGQVDYGQVEAVLVGAFDQVGHAVIVVRIEINEELFIQHGDFRNSGYLPPAYLITPAASGSSLSLTAIAEPHCRPCSYSMYTTTAREMIPDVFSAPKYTGPVSDHFDGHHFINPRPAAPKGFADFFRFMWLSKRGDWSKWTENRAYPPPPKRLHTGELRVTFVNHATVLIQMEGLNILTDPIWSMRCSPVSFAGPKRVRAPGVAFEDLPPLDVIIVSHNHYDHLDLPTLKRLYVDHPQARIITSLGNKLLLNLAGLSRVEEMDWGDVIRLSDDLALHSLPSQHFSGRGTSDRLCTLWMSCMLTGRSGNVYFAADSGMGPHFAEIGERFGPIQLALLPIGSYLPRWFMRDVHLSPAEAVEAHRILRAERSIGIHFGTFELGTDGQYQAVEELSEALEAVDGERPDFTTLDFGESRLIP